MPYICNLFFLSLYEIALELQNYCHILVVLEKYLLMKFINNFKYKLSYISKYSDNSTGHVYVHVLTPY